MQPGKSRVAVLDNMTDIDNYARLSVFFSRFLHRSCCYFFNS